MATDDAPAITLTLLTRAGCGLCSTAARELHAIAAEFGLEAEEVDVDARAATDPAIRAEFGDRVPVVLLNGEEHSYYDVDAPRLRADLQRLISR